MKSASQSSSIALAAVLTAAACLGAADSAGAAQPAYPSKAVVIVVPSSPGGSLDAVTRIISVKLGELWKQPVVVENKPGANFAIGAAQVARAPADGYTLLYAHDGALAINPVLYPNLSYNPLTELTPVGRVVDLPLVLYVPKDSPFHSVADLIKSLRAAPGKYNHASGGTATMMVSELFKSVAAVDYTDVPYKGGGPAVVAVAGGEADFTFADPGSAAAMLATGRIHGLATASAKRLRLQPDLPTIAETVPAYSAVSWSGLHAPAGTPPEIIRKINADLAKVLAMPDVRKRLDDLGVEVNPSTPEELHQQIVADTERWKQLVKTRHISIQ